MTRSDRLFSIVPGLLLCLAVSAVAIGLEHLETWLFGRAWLEGLVLAILLGTAVRTWLPVPASVDRGIRFSAHTVLEIAIVLLGASISIGAIRDAGPELVLGIAGVVVVALSLGFMIGRVLGLPTRLAVLVACGNAICGNSAIVAAAPAIEAEADDVAAAIAFTAVLGIAVVLLLPILHTVFGTSLMQHGILAGLTVYAVPQVLAATAPVGALSVQVGTLVKLVRVLMLGPVVVVLGLVAGRASKVKLSATRLVPWFIVGFLVMMGLRSANLLPQAILPVFAEGAEVFTVLAMAGLGLTVNLRSVLYAGGRVISAATLSLLALGSASVGLITLLHIS